MYIALLLKLNGFEIDFVRSRTCLFFSLIVLENFECKDRLDHRKKECDRF